MSIRNLSRGFPTFVPSLSCCLEWRHSSIDLLVENAGEALCLQPNTRLFTRDSRETFPFSNFPLALFAILAHRIPSSRHLCYSSRWKQASFLRSTIFSSSEFCKAEKCLIRKKTASTAKAKNRFVLRAIFRLRNGSCSVSCSVNDCYHKKGLQIAISVRKKREEKLVFVGGKVPSSVEDKYRNSFLLSVYKKVPRSQK